MKLAADRLRQADEIKDNFLATVSHELRTPLTVIGGVAEILLRKANDPDGAARSTLLKRLKANAAGMEHLIEQILDHTRLDAGKVLLSPTSILLEEILVPLVRPFESHKFSIEMPKGLRVFVDSNALTHILNNLLSNAVKFSSQGSNVRVTASVDGSDVVVRVSDEGVGIPADERAHVFDRFYQGVAAAERRGSGLGLSIACRYAKLFGGRIWIEADEPGRKGATFAFSIPYPQ